MRLVVYSDGYSGPGWYHVDRKGFHEGQAPSCEASIHRFDMEWPDDCTNLNHMLFNNDPVEEHGQKWRQPTPNHKALYERDKEQA